MKLITLSRPYAKALYEISLDDTSKSWLDIMQICSQLDQERDVTKFLNNHYINGDSLNEFISAIFTKAKIKDIPKSFENFLKLLIHNNRVALLPTISKMFIKSYNDANDILDTTIISAKKLTKEEQDLLVTSLKKHYNKEIKLTIEIDPTLIGGIIVEIDGTITDGSIKGRLDQLIKTLV